MMSSSNMDKASYEVAEIKRITDADEIKKILPVISSAWGMPDLSAALKDTINAMRFHGGLVLAAYSGSKIIGMQFSFPGYRKGKVYLYSHMTGVSEDNKYSGVGRMLKLYQKEWALDHSFDLIAWTYDPVRSLNAYFNLAKLGAISRNLLHNFYGTMEDSLNRGIPTHRLVAEWWIKKDKFYPIPQHDEYAIIEKSGSPIFNYDLDERELKVITVGLPTDFSEIQKNDLSSAVRIKQSISSILEDLFSRGYIAFDFLKREETSSYVLIRDTDFSSRYGENIFKE